MNKTYTFAYTSTKTIAYLVFSGLFITIGISVLIAMSHATDAAASMIAVLIMFPIAVFLLRKMAVRQGSATLHTDRVHLKLDGKYYDIPFSSIKSYILENTQSVKLRIRTGMEIISIPVHMQFTNHKSALVFFEDFNKTLKQYAKRSATTILRDKHFFISRDATRMLTVFSIFIASSTFYFISEREISIIKASIFIGIIIFLWGLQSREKRKYNKETPSVLYDHDEAYAQSFRKPVFLSILAITLLGFTLRSVFVITNNMGESAYMQRNYADYRNSLDVALIDFSNSIFNPYEDMEPKEMFDYQTTYLEYAIDNDNAKAVSAMLSAHPIDLEKPLDDYMTPLMFALYSDRLQAAKTLLEHGARLDHIVVDEKYNQDTIYTFLDTPWSGNESFKWLVLENDILYKNENCLKINLQKLDSNRDLFIFKLQQQIAVLTIRSDYENILLQFADEYLNSADKDNVIEKYIAKNIDHINNYDQIIIRNARMESGSYSDGDEEVLLASYELGNENAALDLGWLYSEKELYEKAIKWFHKSFKVSKDGIAEYSLAYMYDKSLNDPENAIKYYQLSIQKDNLSAVQMLLNNYPEVNNDINNDISLKAYPKLKPLEKTALVNATDAITLAEHYTSRNIRDFKRALHWCKIAIENGNKDEKQKAKFNMGFAYFEQEEYQKSIEIFMSIQDYKNAKLNIGKVHYFNKDNTKAIAWYKKALKAGELAAGESLGLLYHEQKDSLNSAAYMLAMTGYLYTKEKMLSLLRDDWKIDEATLKKAYELQKTLDIPKHYTGGID